MEEKNILLNEIDHNQKTVHEAIGVSEEEFVNLRKQIHTDYTIKTLQEKLGLNEEEIYDVVKEMCIADEVILSKGVAELWKRQGKDQVTLLDFVGTAMLLLQMLKIFKKVLFGKRIPVIVIGVLRTRRREPYFA